MKKLLFIFLGMICSMGINAQNQFHISQYMLHQPFMNPAAIGSYANLNGAIFYKNQWTGFEGAPNFQGINLSSPLKGGNNHLGFTFINDQIGVNTNMDISASYAYKIKTSSKSRLSLGLSASARLMQSNYASMTDVSSDPLFQANTPMIFQPNFKFGSYFYTKKFYLGMSIPNILKNSIDYVNGYQGSTEFDVNDMHLYIQSGYTMTLSTSLDLTPSVLIKQVAGAPLQGDINAHLIFKKKLGFGLSYRTSKELAMLLNYQITDMFKLGYAYDMNFSELSNYSSGSHEIMLIFQQKKMKANAIIEAPRY